MFKNISEAEQLDRFLAAYEEATSERMSIVSKTERPDFICCRSDGTQVGIEFTLVLRHPDDTFLDEALSGVREMDWDQAVAKMWHQTSIKEAKRRSEGWVLPEACILVLSIPDCPIADFAEHLILEDYQNNGFLEIWVSDFTQIEAYSHVQLFCLKPKCRWGLYCEHGGKPFG